MPRVFLNRSVQIQPKSWREIVQVIFPQVLTKEGSEKPQKLPTRFGEEPFFYGKTLEAGSKNPRTLIPGGGGISDILETRE